MLRHLKILKQKIFHLSESFHMIFGELNNDNYNRLERGTAIIKDQNLLNQYMHSFGKMHQAKLAEGFDKLPWNNLAKLDFGCIDWGCGFGLASIVLHDYLIKK